MEKSLFTINEFCALTGVGRTFVYQLLKRGELKAIKIGRRTLIRPEDLRTWMANLSEYSGVTLIQRGVDGTR